MQRSARRDPQLTVSKRVAPAPEAADMYTFVPLNGSSAIGVGPGEYTQLTLDFGVKYSTPPCVIFHLESTQEDVMTHVWVHSLNFATAVFGVRNHGKNGFTGRIHYQVSGSVLTSSLVAK